jgi:hypothetical protein
LIGIFIFVGSGFCWKCVLVAAELEKGFDFCTGIWRLEMLGLVGPEPEGLGPVCLDIVFIHHLPVIIIYLFYFYFFCRCCY